MATIQERAERLIANANVAEPAQQQQHGGTAWRPAEDSNVPNPLTGVITGFGEHSNEFGTQRVMNVQDLDGKEWSVWLSAQALKRAIADHDPQPGQLIFIHYKGKKISAKTGYSYYAFNVHIEPVEQAELPMTADSEDDIPF